MTRHDPHIATAAPCHRSSGPAARSAAITVILHANLVATIITKARTGPGCRLVDTPTTQCAPVRGTHSITPKQQNP